MRRSGLRLRQEPAAERRSPFRSRAKGDIVSGFALVGEIEKGRTECAPREEPAPLSVADCVVDITIETDNSEHRCHHSPQ